MSPNTRGWQHGCLVLLRGGNSVGTGFFITHDLVVTCAHVAGPTKGAILEATWRDDKYRAQVVTTSPSPEYSDSLWPYPDLAVLRLVAPPEDHRSLWLDDRLPEDGAVLLSAGYSTLFNPTPRKRSGRATNAGDEELDDRTVFRLVNDEFPQGVSGGPVLNPATGGVCGVIKTARKPGTDMGGLVLPTRALRDLENYRQLRREHDLHHARTESEHVVAATPANPRNISPGEERRVRGILAEIDYDEKRVAGRRLGFGPEENKAHDYGDVVIDRDEYQSETGAVPPAVEYLIELVIANPEATNLRDCLNTVAGRMGIGPEVWERLKSGPYGKPTDTATKKKATGPATVIGGGGRSSEDPPPLITGGMPRARRSRRRPLAGKGAVLATLAAAVLILISIFLPSDPAAPVAVCAHPAEVRVLTSPAQLGTYRQVADAFEDWTAEQHDGCRAVNVYVYDAPQDIAKRALEDSWVSDPDDPEGTQYLRDAGPQADVWLPGSQVELDAVAELRDADDQKLIGSTPLVLGVPASRVPAAAEMYERQPKSWLSVVTTAMEREWHVVRPAPDSSIVGELATVALYATYDQAAGSSPRDIERWLELSLDAGKYPIGDSDALLCRQRQLIAPNETAAVITSEQFLVRYNNGDPLGSRCHGAKAGEPLQAFYPADTVTIELHFVPLTWDSSEQSQGTRDAATAFGDWLTGEAGKKALLAAGVRPTAMGNALAAPLTEQNGVLTEWPFGRPEPTLFSGEEHVAALETYVEARRPGRVLLAVDASGSMDAPADNQGTTRFGVALRGVSTSLDHMAPGRDEFGLWLFSTRAGPSGVEQALPIGQNTEEARELLRRAPWRPNGDTPLYRTVADGVRTVGDPGGGAVNALVVLTDGQDTASQDWLDDVGRAIAANPQVRIFLVAIGDANCETPVFAKLVTDTAGQCLPASTGTVDDTLNTLFRSLWTKG
jgi:hypothetical protein